MRQQQLWVRCSKQSLHQISSGDVDGHPRSGLSFAEHTPGQVEVHVGSRERAGNPGNVGLRLVIRWGRRAIGDERHFVELRGHSCQIVERHTLPEEHTPTAVLSAQLVNKQQGDVVDFTFRQVQDHHTNPVQID